MLSRLLNCTTTRKPVILQHSYRHITAADITSCGASEYSPAAAFSPARKVLTKNGETLHTSAQQPLLLPWCVASDRCAVIASSSDAEHLHRGIPRSTQQEKTGGKGAPHLNTRTSVRITARRVISGMARSIHIDVIRCAHEAGSARGVQWFLCLLTPNAPPLALTLCPSRCIIQRHRVSVVLRREEEPGASKRVISPRPRLLLGRSHVAFSASNALLLN